MQNVILEADLVTRMPNVIAAGLAGCCAPPLKPWAYKANDQWVIELDEPRYAASGVTLESARLAFWSGLAQTLWLQRAEREGVSGGGSRRQQSPRSFQDRVGNWLLECFGSQIVYDRIERNQRFREETLELVQACGCTREEVRRLVDYVYGRPPGGVAQKVDGVAITLAALCDARSLQLKDCAEVELERVQKRIPEIRAKQATKPNIKRNAVGGGG